MNRKTSKPPKIALALAGGGPLGAIYEIGALCALEESLNGLDFTKLQHYVGVSAGGFIAAGLANGISPRALCAAFIENENTGKPSDIFDPSGLLVPAYGEFVRRGIMLPGLLLSALWQVTAGRKSLTHALELLGPALPAGMFSSEQIHTQLSDLFSREGRTNDFRKLKTKLTLVATNLHADILSDLAAALAGSLGIAPTGNIDPERRYPSMFEPIHGSAFDIMGKGLANPVGTFWSVVMMLEHLGEPAAAGRLMAAIEQVTANPALHTGDLGGKATTAQVTQAVCALMAS